MVSGDTPIHMTITVKTIWQAFIALLGAIVLLLVGSWYVFMAILEPINKNVSGIRDDFRTMQTQAREDKNKGAEPETDIETKLAIVSTELGAFRSDFAKESATFQAQLKDVFTSLDRLGTQYAGLDTRFGRIETALSIELNKLGPVPIPSPQQPTR
jgi:hypothetical protein